MTNHDTTVDARSASARHSDPNQRHFLPEIQALRAVAVLIVVLYHLWPNRLTGGFVGVDVFFVISGFLITRHLVKDAEINGRISLTQFWAKRARRLLPASMVVLAVTLVSVLLFVPQIYWQQFLKQIGASAVYAQNWVLASDSIQYFAAENNASPVQHFWSLSVEEQFYLVWPLIIVAVLMLTRRLSPVGRRRALVTTLALITAASLAYSVYLTAVSPGQAYFVTPTRAWEFAAGGLLALLGTAPASRTSLRVIASWSGWLVIAGTTVFFSAATQFPGYMALIPVIGTLAVIWAGSPESRWAPSTYLAVGPVQGIGNISYSMYLWHWPMIILATLTVDDFHWRAKVFMLPAIFLLAWATTTFVENPVRQGAWLVSRKPRYTFVATAVTMALIAGPAFAIGSHMDMQAVKDASRSAEAASSSGPCFGAGVTDPELDCEAIVYDKLTPNPTTAADDLPEVYSNGCYTELDDSAAHPCAVGVRGAAFRVALIGDSHAAHWYPTLKKIAVERGWELTPFMKSACPLSAAPKADKVEKVAASCAAWNAEVAAAAEKSAPFNLVIVSHSATGDAGYGSSAAAAAGFQKSWKTFTDRGAELVVIRDIPKAEEGTTACVAKHAEKPAVCDLDAGRAQSVKDLMVVAAAEQPKVNVVDMNEFFCDADTCKTVLGGVVIYRDTHHMTATWAATLSPYLSQKLDLLGVTG